MLGGIPRLAAGAIALGASAFAQAQTGDAVPRERIEVTGTNIPRIASETGLPVQAITREEIERAGIQTAQDLLDRVSAHMSYQGWSEALGVGGGNPGLTAASLRGVGSQRTLVLLNGRRLAPYASTGGSGSDLSSIPAAAIERVEVLKDGASAIYGTDAIGGVINFILRRDYRGLEVGGNAYVTDQGGGDSRRANATFGYGDLERDRFNALLTLDYLHQERLRAAEREFSRTAYLPQWGYDATSTFSWPANITQPRLINPATGAVVRPGGFQGLRNPTVRVPGGTADSCLPPYSFVTLQTPLVCRFDYPSVIDSLPDVKKAQATGRLAWQLAPETRLFVEGNYYRGEFIYRIAPTPVAGIPGGLDIAPGSPFYPTDFVASLPGGRTDLPVRLSYRTVELGPRTADPETTQWRTLAGVQGHAGGWSYEAALTYDTNRQVQSLASGYVDGRLFGPLVRSGGVNPFAMNTPEALERMRATQFAGEVYRAASTSREVDGKASGTIAELAAGPVDVAFGAAARRETLEQVSQPILQTNSIVGGGGQFPSQKESERTVKTLFAEVNAHVLRGLEANLAVRLDHYSDFGTTTNPKLTLRWQPRKDLMLRASGGTGFRAPTLSDLFLPDVNGFTGQLYDDPVRCPVTRSELDCQVEFETVGGGNEALQPEKSRQLNLGVVFEPVRGFSASLDYYHVEIRDLVTEVPVFSIFNEYQRWGSLMVRRPPDAANPGLPGRIDYVLVKPVNGGTMKTSGIDVVLDASAATAAGRIAFSLDGTYVIDYEVQEFETVVTGPGTGHSGAISRWRHYATIDWSWGPWGATLGQTYQNGYSEIDLRSCPFFTGFPDACTARRDVGSQEIYDVQVRYSGVKGLRLAAGVRNLFDRAPPFAITPQNSHQVGYDPSYTDPRGRTFYATLRYTFQ